MPIRAPEANGRSQRPADPLPTWSPAKRELLYQGVDERIWVVSYRVSSILSLLKNPGYGPKSRSLRPRVRGTLISTQTANASLAQRLRSQPRSKTRSSSYSISSSSFGGWFQRTDRPRRLRSKLRPAITPDMSARVFLPAPLKSEATAPSQDLSGDPTFASWNQIGQFSLIDALRRAAA